MPGIPIRTPTNPRLKPLQPFSILTEAPMCKYRTLQDHPIWTTEKAKLMTTKLLDLIPLDHVPQKGDAPDGYTFDLFKIEGHVMVQV